MNVTSVCLFLIGCVSFLVQRTSSAALMNVHEPRDLQKNIQNHQIMTREIHEAEADEVPAISDSVIGESSLLTRLRRQVAAMAGGNRSYSRGRRMHSGRLRGRRRYHQSRNRRLNRVQHW